MDPIYSIQFLKLIFYSSISIPIQQLCLKYIVSKWLHFFFPKVDLTRNFKSAIMLAYTTRMVWDAG